MKPSISMPLASILIVDGESRAWLMARSPDVVRIVKPDLLTTVEWRLLFCDACQFEFPGEVTSG